MWNSYVTHNFERSMIHGMRRAAEMDEVAKMAADLGLPNDLSGSAYCNDYCGQYG